MDEEYDIILGHYDYTRSMDAVGAYRELPQSAAYINNNVVGFSSSTERLRTFILKEVGKYMSWQDFISLPRSHVNVVVKTIDEKTKTAADAANAAMDKLGTHKKK